MLKKVKENMTMVTYLVSKFTNSNIVTIAFFWLVSVTDISHLYILNYICLQ